MKLTVDAIVALNPCRFYHREKVEALVQRLSTETPFEVLASIPLDDAYWFLSQALSGTARVQWAEACARRAKEYADGADAAAADAADADAAYWAASWAVNAAARSARASVADAAYWAAAYAARAAYYAGGEDAQRAEHHLATRHGLMLLEGAK